MDTKKTCKECAAELPANAPQGLCPRCLAGMVMSLAFTGQPHSPGMESPPVCVAERIRRWCKHKPTIASLSAAVVLDLFAGLVTNNGQATRIASVERSASAGIAPVIKADDRVIGLGEPGPLARKPVEEYRALTHASDAQVYV